MQRRRIARMEEDIQFILNYILKKEKKKGRRNMID